MSTTKLRLYLAAWLIAVMAPGLFVAYVWNVGLNTTIGGGVLGIWVAGFIAQLLLFMTVAKQAKSSGLMMLFMFVISVLPFGVDWGYPAGWWVPAGCGVVALGIALYVDRTCAGAKQVQEHGILATATVLEVLKPKMNVVVNNVYIERTLRVRIQRSDGAPAYESKYRNLFMLGEIPSPGDTFQVRVDPKRPDHFEDADDTAPAPTSSGAGSSAAAKAARASAAIFGSDDADGSAGEGWQQYRPGVAATLPGSAGSRDVAANLKLLADLHTSGQLTDEEYAEAKAKLLG